MFPSRIPPELPAEVEALAHELVDPIARVRTSLGVGLREELYKGALSIELDERGIGHDREAQFPILYKGRKIGLAKPDFLVGEHLVLEAKAAADLCAIDFAQTMTYLRVTSRPLGLLVNFHQVPLRAGIKRVLPGRE